MDNEVRLGHEPAPVDLDLCAHWYEVLRVLAAADNVLGVQGVLDVVRNQIILIDRHRGAAVGGLERK